MSKDSSDLSDKIYTVQNKLSTHTKEYNITEYKIGENKKLIEGIFANSWR